MNSSNVTNRGSSQPLPAIPCPDPHSPSFVTIPLSTTPHHQNHYSRQHGLQELANTMGLAAEQFADIHGLDEMGLEDQQQAPKTHSIRHSTSKDFLLCPPDIELAYQVGQRKRPVGHQADDTHDFPRHDGEELLGSPSKKRARKHLSSEMLYAVKLLSTTPHGEISFRDWSCVHTVWVKNGRPQPLMKLINELLLRMTSLDALALAAMFKEVLTEALNAHLLKLLFEHILALGNTLGALLLHSIADSVKAFIDYNRLPLTYLGTQYPPMLVEKLIMLMERVGHGNTITKHHNHNHSHHHHNHHNNHQVSPSKTASNGHHSKATKWACLSLARAVIDLFQHSKA